MTVEKSFSPLELAQYIDHTLLRPDATEAEIERLCQEARTYHFKAVCVEAKWLPTVRTLLEGSAVAAATVIGFPGGSVSSVEKQHEARAAREWGADEMDMVLNRDWLKAGDFAAVFRDVEGVVSEAGVLPVKVILETSELNQQQKVIACALAKAAGARFVKTSTGFSGAGATVEDIRLMRAVVGADFGVKASGGVRDLAQALLLIAAGANRLGTSAGVAILQGLNSPVTAGTLPGHSQY